MILKQINITILIWVLLNNTIIAQENLSDIDSLASFFKEKIKAQPIKYKIESTNNELKLGLNVLFVGYKNFISSQDSPNRCVFQLSCSEYSNLAIKQYGLVKGSQMAFDRLLRCHPFNKKHLTFDPNLKLYIDPLSDD